MKIFLTGGTGFIGSHFINHAHKAGHIIYAIRRKNSSVRIPLEKEPEWIEGDLSGSYSSILKDCDILVHLAAHSVNVPYDNIENCLHWNLIAPFKLLEDARKNGLINYLVAGSCFEYGENGIKYDFIPPEAALLPTQSYSISKAAASTVLYGWASVNKTKLKILRIFQVFGEGEQSTRFWPSLKAAAIKGADFSMTEGMQIRDFINVINVAERFVNELDFSNVTEGIPLIDNVGTGKPQTLKQFAEYWWKKWEATGRLRFGEISYRENEIMRYVPLIKH